MLLDLSVSPVTLNPAKVKAELTKIKETLLDATDADDSKVFLAVLQVELIQRGVLVSDASNVLEKVQSVAGKPLVEETAAKTPVQLLVGSCVIAGRLAERLAVAATSDSSSTATAILSQHDLDPIRNRCQTVDDPRFLGVLDNNPTAHHFFLVAEAYYLRAAQLQTDEKPVPWKKAWDCITARHHQQVVSWQAIPAVTQLLSIAQSKGNQKRAMELSLILVDCYLDGSEVDEDAKPSSAWKLVHLYRPSKRPKDALKRAATLLRECQDPDENNGDLYSLLLWYRLTRKQENGSEVEVYQYGEQLRDVYLKRAVPNQHSATLQAQLRLHLEWMTKSTTGEARWTRLAHFLVPLGEHWVTHPESTEDIEAALRLTAALLVPQVEWMVLSDDMAPAFSVDTLHWATTVLQSKVAASIASAAKEAIGSTNDKEDPEVVRSRAGVHSLTALLALRGDPTAERSVAETVTKGKKANRSCGTEFGFPFLEFLVCWSGLNQHPWSTVTQAEARILIHRARQCIKAAKDTRKRVPSSAEEILLQLGEADIEGFAYDSGLADRATSLYSRLSGASTTYFGSLIAIRSQAGLADAALKVCHFELATSAAQKTLNLVETSMSEQDCVKEIPFWSAPNFATTVLDFQKVNARRLLANTYLQSGDVSSAQGVLEQAVSDSPNDSAANFALGSFRLYRSIFLESGNAAMEKDAQVQLLKAAEMDSTKAGPFALLGFWYEKKGDLKRAVGCYSKALALDPAHPVAGRGVLRLAPTASLDAVFDMAIKVSSSSIGWAWHQVGIRKALQEGNDELAVVAFLKTLRCRDIERPESDLLAPFFSNPSAPEPPNKKEMSSTLSELAMCYRRLGRYTAAVRSFHSAIELWNEEAPPHMLCSCAQVELELGLPDDAEQKFKIAMERSDDDVAIISAYGRSAALLSMARRDAQDGKVGSAHKKLMLGIDVCSGSTQNCDHVCFRKAAGDLHSFAASLPPDVFSNEDESPSADPSAAQVLFVSKGEQYYHTALEQSEDDEIRLGLATDIGSNRLLCAQLRSAAESKGLHCSLSANVNDLFFSAADAFRSAIEMDPEYAPAWCGLGCSVIHSDPLLAQHAFVRSLELENLSPDTYANLSFLYSKHQLFSASSRISDLLSEVADTPMMWINRAAILESTGRKEALQQASDAYSAALQVAKLPAAVAGLAMTCRYNPSIQTPISQSVLFTAEYLGSTGGMDTVVSALGTVQELEMSSKTSGLKQALRTRLGSLHEQLSKEQELEDMDGTPLDVEAFQSVIDELAHQDDVTTPVETCQYSLQRQVANNPSNGSLWLELSKELVSQSGAKASLVAARRAASLLLTSLYHPTTTTKNPDSIVDSGELSESLTFKYWLESLPETGSEESSSPNSIDLQKALLMDPGNSIARQALRAMQ